MTTRRDITTEALQLQMFWRFTRWNITSRGAAFFRVDGQPHERLCSLPVSDCFSAWTVRKKQTKRAETGIEPGSRDPESSALDHSAVVATQSERTYCTRKHNTARNAALPGERTTVRTAVLTGMCINLPCQKKKREVTRAGFELANLRL